MLPPAPPAAAIPHTPSQGRAGSEEASILVPFSQVFQQFSNTWPRSAPASLITISLEVFTSTSPSFLISAFPAPRADGPLLCLPQPRGLLGRGDHPGPQGLFPASSLSAQRICVQQDPLQLWIRHGACPSPRRQGRGKDGAVTPDRKQQDPDLRGL